MDSILMNRAADNIRVLIAAMVEKAKSGHPGGSMGGADFINVLFSKFLNYDPEHPEWFARDRFFLDPGHMSPMLYGVLALSGKYTMEELRQFRQWGSVTPGHPELCPARGIENGSGPLGQGHVMAVGCAIAERFLAARFGEVVAHKTYAFISDGGIQEEISQGAGRIAGHLGLHNLIMFYDANDVQLSTRVEEVTGEDTAAKYRAWNWNVIEIDGTDPDAIAGALSVAIEEKQRPTLIIGHTIMARKCVAPDGTSCEGWVSTHGQPLSKAGVDVPATIRALGGDPENPWQIFDDVKALYADRRKQLISYAAARREQEKQWIKADPEAAHQLADYLQGILPEIDWNAIKCKPDAATRTASAEVLKALSAACGNMIVSSADLANSDKTEAFLTHTRAMTPGDLGGGFIHAGVAELTMASIMNGIALHGGLIAACGTFFVFSDYMKPAIRMSALMELPVKYIFTHDAFRVGEDGPTHQPVEHEAQMRLLEQMNNLSGRPSTLVLRPADSAETIRCWQMAMENKQSPTILILSRQDVPDLPVPDRHNQARVAERGAYPVRDPQNPAIALIGNGSEVSLLLNVAEELAKEGIQAKVISAPSLGLYAAQDKAYRDTLLPDGLPIYGLTAGLPSTLLPLMKGQWEIYGLQRFGASAPYKVLDQKFGYVTENILNRVKHFLENKR